MEQKRVLIAMSGGVDSSAAAVVLQKQGYACGGAMLRLRCDAPGDDAAEAKAVAEYLQMPFYLFDESEKFRTCVMEHFVRSYCTGLTPNPCIECNRELKFGALLDRALALGYDYIATGHYARVDYDEKTGRYRLLRGKSRKKDQSYVLYQLTQRHLRHLLLPIGELDKDDVRQLLEKEAVPIARKPDSQDICFIPDGDYVAFLERSGVSLTPGHFIDAQGRVLGEHRGLPCYTLGQGKGLGIALGKHVYVTGKCASENTVTLGDNEELFSRELTAHTVNWISGDAPQEAFSCTAKTRYSQQEADCRVTPLAQQRIRVEFQQPQRAITAGQAVVLYDGDAVLGGGTIE